MTGEPGPWIFVIGGAQRGGAEGQFVRLAARLRAAGEPVECVFLFAGGPLTEELDHAGVPYSVLRKNPGPSSMRKKISLILAVGRLAALLIRRRPALVMAWLTFATWPTLLLSQFLTSAARVAGIRGEILPSEIRWAAPLFRHALRNADAVVANSNALVAEAVAWGARPSAVTVIPNGIELPAPRGSNVDNMDAVVVANYRPYKGHADLLRALALCRSDVHVRMCGAGPDKRQVEELAADLSVQDRVHFVADPADIGSELERAGFAIHPSRTEGLSNAILEEMAAGLPVIAMSVGGNPMLVESGVNGYLLSVGDHISLARAIDELALDVELRRRLSAGSRRKVAQFSWDACTAQYQRVLRQLDVSQKTCPADEGL